MGGIEVTGDDKFVLGTVIVAGIGADSFLYTLLLGSVHA